VPPLVLILPPLIWGWLTYRVMAFDALADHAGAEERREIFKRHRWWLLGMGVVTGYMGAAPSLVWSLGFMAVALAPFLVPLSIWLYTLIFAFSSLWFSHYGLSALQSLRAQRSPDHRHDPNALGGGHRGYGAFMKFGVIIIGDEDPLRQAGRQAFVQSH